MEKRLFFASSVSLMHIGRLFMLAEWEQRLGNQIHFTKGSKGLQLLNLLKSEIL